MKDIPSNYKPLSSISYIGYSLLFSIPFIGFILLIIFSFDNSNINRRNYARSYWFKYILLFILIILIIIVWVSLPETTELPNTIYI